MLRVFFFAIMFGYAMTGSVPLELHKHSVAKLCLGDELSEKVKQWTKGGNCRSMEPGEDEQCRFEVINWITEGQVNRLDKCQKTSKSSKKARQVWLFWENMYLKTLMTLLRFNQSHLCNNYAYSPVFCCFILGFWSFLLVFVALNFYYLLIHSAEPKFRPIVTIISNVLSVRPSVRPHY